VIEGTPDFFAVTKRIHNRLHGAEGDGGLLDEQARRIYDAVLAANAEQLFERVREGDVVILHDPQTIGLVDAMKSAGAAVIWRCHVELVAALRSPAVLAADDLAIGAADAEREHVEQQLAVAPGGLFALGERGPPREAWRDRDRADTPQALAAAVAN